ncbi:TetR/AcrR family transcriptional regulator [Nocardioides marmotae]|uniref:TetR/AcrR family transcriptional regulator n=1 Tax=Nocardioides marmotae TaxID=2663857 RepID=UPI0012B5A6E9|nr:TetR/AcrR family transcriptional regulator [Nocardioides marmotae]MBC9731844.1 TetR/AcrR family transcriptional regulator [Nocardioides marmotae]MTB82963.1 TetR family transcriptional regulator [Nocardioides marmotae]
MPRPDVRLPLLDAAERLFAERGIATVSDRQVAEAAGNSNHSAVRYYFGGRVGLLEALVERHHAEVEPAQERMFERSDSLLGDVRALVIPLTEVFAAQPTPSWRARCLQQVMTDPATADLMRSSAGRYPTSTRIVASVAQRLSHLDPRTVEARGRLTLYLVISACAEIEERAQASGEPARWAEAGAFLCDAVGGLLQAPVTTPLTAPAAD